MAALPNDSVRALTPLAMAAGLLLTPGCGSGGGSGPCEKPPITAEFEYLPSREKLRISISDSLVTVERRSGEGRVLSTVTAEASPAVRTLEDSLWCTLGKVAFGRYAKQGVLDGTRLTIRAGERTVNCDNCLNDFVLQAGGMKMVRPSARLVPLRDAVNLLNRIASTVEGRSTSRRRTATIVTDPSRLTSKDNTYKVLRFEKQESK